MTANLPPARPGNSLEVSDPAVIAQIIERAASPGFERWWAQVSGSGFCASPVHLAGHCPVGPAKVMGRCKNRRAAVCPSCSQLYAGDTWQLVHAGITGGHHGLPATIACHPMVFATLTAPSYGAVHTRPRTATDTAPGPCHPARTDQRCVHGRPVGCSIAHDDGDAEVGQPLCADCYDYVDHVLFTWHAPELWHRFTIRLRRAVAARLAQLGENPKAVRVSYVKVVELQRRAVPHFHAVVRLDAADDPGTPPTPPHTGLAAEDLAVLVVRAAAAVRLTVPGPTGDIDVRFGAQTDAQALHTTPDRLVGPTDQGTTEGRRVAAYLAKYVTKSVADFGIGARRISDQAIPELAVTDHVRRILETVTYLAQLPERHRMVEWLHTLGYRGHITSKTRRYSTTMGALLANRAAWRQQQAAVGGTASPTSDRPDGHEPGDWHFTGYGHANNGERLLALSAAARTAEERRVAREAAADHEGEEP